MLKRIISQVLIVSILWPNLLSAMDTSDEKGEKGTSHRRVLDESEQIDSEIKAAERGDTTSTPPEGSPTKEGVLSPKSDAKSIKHNKKEKRKDEGHLVPEVDSLTSDPYLQSGSWTQYPHQPMLPIRSTANGSIQEERELEETDSLLKYPRGFHTTQRNVHDLGTYVIDSYQPISGKRHRANDRHRKSLRRVSHESKAKPFFPKSKIYVFRGQIPELFEFLMTESVVSREVKDLRFSIDYEAPEDEEGFPPHSEKSLSPRELDFDEVDPRFSKKSTLASLSEVEEGRVFPLNPRAVKSFQEEITKLPSSIKSLLSGTAYQDIEQHSSKTDWLAIGLGTFIGTGLVIAMGPVYDGGLVYMRDMHGWNFINYFENNRFAGLTPNAWYIALTLLPDAVPRNVNLLKRVFRYLKEETGYVLRTLGTGAAVFLPSLTELGYLAVFELYAMNKEGVHGYNNQFAIATMVLGPFLLVDSMGGNFETAWELCEDIKVWAKKSSSYLARAVPHSWLPDFEDPLVEKFQGNLKKLTHFFRWCPEKQLNEIYDNTFDALRSASVQFPDLEGNDLDVAKTLCVMNYLLSIGDQLEKGIQRVKSWYETISDMVIYGNLALGSLYRVLVPQLIVKTLAGIFFSKAVSGGIGWGATGLGFLFQTALEYKGMKNLEKEVVWEEEPTGHSSHSYARKGFKGVALWQAFVFIPPLFVLCYQVTDIWFGNDWYMLMSIPFLIAEFATLANQFNNSYNRKVATAATKAVHKVASCAKCSKTQLCTDCKRDRLIRLSHKLSKKIPNISPELRQTIQTSFDRNHDVDSEEEEY